MPIDPGWDEVEELASTGSEQVQAAATIVLTYRVPPVTAHGQKAWEVGRQAAWASLRNILAAERAAADREAGRA